MRLEQLEYLIEISKTNSIGQASKNLHITQQSLSKALMNLEDELNAVLLERTNKGVKLTQDGKQALSHAQTIIHELHEFKKSFDPSSERPAYHIYGDLSVAHTNSFDFSLISTTIQQYSNVYPNINIILNQMSMPDLFKALAENTIDIGMVTMTSDYNINKKIIHDDLSKFSFSPLAEDKLLVAVGKQSALAQNKSMSIRSLLKYPLILLQHNCSDDPENNWLTCLLSLYGKPHYVLRTNDFKVYQTAISNNTGIGFLTAASVSNGQLQSLDDIILIPVRDKFQLFYQYAMSNENPHSNEANLYLPYLSGIYNHEP